MAHAINAQPRRQFLARQAIRLAVYGPSYPGRKLFSTPAHLIARLRGAQVATVTLPDGIRTQVMRVPARPDTPQRPPVVLLHGWMELKEMHLPHARLLARHGHDVLLVDQRGHGRSAATPSTIGTRETHDLTAIIDDARKRQWITGRYCLWGFSMGGAVAIRHAVTDPDVAALVTIAPYADLDAAIDTFRARLPLGMTRETVRAASDQIASEIGFDIDDANPAAVIGNLCAPLLMIEGGLDNTLPADRHSQRLVALKKHGPVESLRVPWANHFLICRRFWPSVDKRVISFYNKYAHTQP
ncbi:alpha/beta hydrolase [Mucisphaera calidilacus]|uniref:2-succinyl-6-hydroxy-2, 4-cyclohexadiene-1-carboxylate synthase n=1 Tax=Mucisphaera calidilacus TaxID=2527982 RepID=A0A518BZ75_9BACT|nr:alpha/beta fold hydrolase [Mucisphaera calidilacus]QDU72264.1 2-succinyl-6-hydroxy-2,4-cyclohexadiene-1-carboxylate synthase [Mucisphaera calidilacus]